MNRFHPMTDDCPLEPLSDRKTAMSAWACVDRLDYSFAEFEFDFLEIGVDSAFLLWMCNSKPRFNSGTLGDMTQFDKTIWDGSTA